MQKPSIPKGTRDFTPAEMTRRNYIFDTIKTIFRKYGFQPIETPAMENLTTLLGKYGEEGDKLLFRILNSGDFLEDVAGQELASRNVNRIAAKISEKGLRYDLTVPFARFVVQHQSEISFPFKRYQIQPVWRADRPQKGRYREFYQCDVDVVGSASLLNEAELLQIIAEVFRTLNIRVTVKLNNRKILSGIAEMIGQGDKITDITVAIDKLEKIGIEKVNEELLSKGLSEKNIEALQPVIQLSGTNDEKLDQLEPFHPERMASRILGMGDIMTLIEKAEQAFDEKKANEMAEKLMKNRFTLTDYYEQLTQLKSMGSLTDLAGMMPGVDAKALAGANIDENMLSKTEAIILSMTPHERDNPSVLNSSRKKRIAKGSGSGIVDINRLLKQFEMMQVMSKQMAKGRMPAFLGGGKKGKKGFF